MELEYLSCALPESVMCLKYAGRFDDEIKLIDIMLKNPAVTLTLSKRLEVERIFALGMKESYCVTFEELLSRLKAEVEDFDRSELFDMIADGRADFRLRDGEAAFSDVCFESLFINTPALNSRLKDAEKRKRRLERSTLLDDIISEIKQNGSAEMSCRVRHTLTPDEGTVSEGETVRVHLPFPKRVEGQQDAERIKLISASHAVKLSGEDYPQRTVCFEEKYVPGMSFSVEYEYSNRAVFHDLSKPAEILETPSDELAGALSELHPHIVFTPYLRRLADELRGGETEPLEIARRFYYWITGNVRYSYMRAYRYLDMIPEFAALNLRGDCGVQALLFITLCRIAGIPAKWQSGMYVTPNGISSHDWARFYIAGRGWLFCDPSFGGGAFRAGNDERRDFYFGNLDPYRLVANSDFQRDFEPEKRFERRDPYDNQSGEIETEARALSDDEFTVNRELLQYRLSH